MATRKCAITGATGGIGAALSEQAAQSGYDLILHGRSEEKLNKLRNRIKSEVPASNIELVVGDLGSAEGTHDVAAAISAHAPKLDLLFNNAGVLLDGIQISSDGLEMHTQVNLIAPYILMQALKPNVAGAAGAIVNVASGAALKAKTLSVQTLRRPEKARKLFGAYAQSKLALVVVTRALGSAFYSDNVALAAVNPGPNKSDMTKGDGMPVFLRLLRPLIYAPPEKGALEVFRVAGIARSQEQPGSFYSRGGKVSLPDFATADDIAPQLLNFCEISAKHSVPA